MKTLASTAPCPCGRVQGKKPLAYAQCCGRFLDGDTPAPDAESLMRSRYSAFVLEREAYLLQTWHHTQRPECIEFDPDVKWLGLVISRVAIIDPINTFVDFVAEFCQAHDVLMQHRESSRFLFAEGLWYYIDAVAVVYECI